MCKAKVFVQPDIFNLVVRRLQDSGWDLKARHVVVTSDLVQCVIGIVDRARENTPRGKRTSSKLLKRQMEVNIPQAAPSPAAAAAAAATAPAPATCDRLDDSSDREVPYIVKRTLVHVPLPSSMRSASSAHPASAP